MAVVIDTSVRTVFDELVCVCFGADGDKKLKIFKNSSEMHISDLKIKPLKPSNDQISISF